MDTADDYDEIKYFLEYQFGQNLSLLPQEHYHIDRHFSYPIHMADSGLQIGYHKMALHSEWLSKLVFLRRAVRLPDSHQARIPLRAV